MDKNLVGKLKGIDGTFSLSVISLKDDNVLLKVTNGIDSNMFSAHAVVTMDFEVVKDRIGERGITTKYIHGFLLP